MNSIQHFVDIRLTELQNNIKNLILKKNDIGKISKIIHTELLNLGSSMLSEIIEDLDKEIVNNVDRKDNYHVVSKRTHKFLSTMGEVKYSRTCFKSKKTNQTEYLVDNMLGITPHERVSSDVEEKLVEEAIQTSYRKSGEEAVYTTDNLSKQAVMNCIKKYSFKPLSKETSKAKKNKKIIYIEADEDHVALQKGGILMPKLIYVHEGIGKENFKSKRNKLINPQYFTEQKSETTIDLWERVLNYIYETYNWDYIKTIYIAGDGASWIKKGTRIISKSKFVLDRFHTKKYIKKASAHMDDITQAKLKDALYEADKNYVEEILEEIVNKTEEETRRKSVLDARQYFFNNWPGIKVYEEDGYDVIGCSAESHISHIFSSRLSSRPKGWSKENARNIANLIVYKLNGGKIIDMVDIRRKNKIAAIRKKKKHTQIQDKIYKKVVPQYHKNIELPIIREGRRNNWLYGLLKEISGA